MYSSGGTLATAGPLGMIISYIFVATVIGANQIAVTEVTCLMPITSGYIRHAEHFVDHSLGFAMGICNIYLAVIPTELSAVVLIMTYWTDLSPAVFVTIFGIVIVVINSYNVRWYGEIEFCFGVLKILLVICLIIVGLVIDLGGAPNHDRLGFRYWKDPGLFSERYATGSLGRFLGIWKSVGTAVYTFSGIQSVCLLAGESEYPRRAIYRAAKSVLPYCHTLFYHRIGFINDCFSH